MKTSDYPGEDMVNVIREDSAWIFARIAADLTRQGFSVVPQGLPSTLTRDLQTQLQGTGGARFASAGIGRKLGHVTNEYVRRGKIRWIAGETDPESRWLDWASGLKTYLNRHLYLGLSAFESHFAQYAPGDFYRTHVDAFRGQANRVLSVVTYLNRDWGPEDGGELIIYEAKGNETGLDTGGEAVATVVPAAGTLVVFRSEEFPHEVLPARRYRHSIAGWFRLNSALGN